RTTLPGRYRPREHVPAHRLTSVRPASPPRRPPMTERRPYDRPYLGGRRGGIDDNVSVACARRGEANCFIWGAAAGGTRPGRNPRPDSGSSEVGLPAGITSGPDPAALGTMTGCKQPP